MKIRKLNNMGIQEFEKYLDLLRNPSIQEQSPIPDLLGHPGLSEAIDLEVEIEDIPFQSRFDLGTYLSERLSMCDQRVISHDVGFWTWLALLYFEQLCPVDQDGRRHPRRNDNYILSKNKNNYHRHAIRTTYLFVKEYGETVRFMFSNPLNKRGELTEQITGRPYFFSCRGLIDAGKHLYYDSIRQIPKRGAASKNRPGTVRRFGLVLRQIELTYDLHSLGKYEILNLLPREFERFMDE